MSRLAAACLCLLLFVTGCGYSFGDIDVLDSAPDPLSPDAATFGVIGDWGRDGWFRQDDVADELGEACERADCRFIISTGDNFYVDGVEGIDDSNWVDSFEDVYTASSLRIPWYPALGNHDYLGDVSAQITYTKVSERWTMPARYFAVERQAGDTLTALFVVLDTVPLVESVSTTTSSFRGTAEWNADRQLRWLDSTLAVTDADWRFVAGHHPVISASAKHKDSPVLQQRLKPILERHDVHAYLSGHVHSLQHLHSEGVDYIVSGGGSLSRKVGRHPDALFVAGVSGFMLGSLTTKEMRFRFIDFKGGVGYEAVIPRIDRSDMARVR